MEANAERACGVAGIDGIDGNSRYEEGFELGRRERVPLRHRGRHRGRGTDGGERREEGGDAHLALAVSSGGRCTSGYWTSAFHQGVLYVPDRLLRR